MDNLTQNTEPVGAEGATSSQDNSSAIETQPVETTEVVSANEVPETGSTNPWDSDPRFAGKTPEEMFNIVQEADKYKGNLSQQAKAIKLLESETGMSMEEIAQRLEQEQQARVQEQYANDPAGYALERVNQLESQLAYQEVEKELGQFIQANPEYSEFKDEILKLGLSIEQDTPFQDIANKYFGKALAKGQESAYKKIETKVQTQATSSASQPQRKVTLEDMKNMSSAEIKAILTGA